MTMFFPRVGQDGWVSLPPENYARWSQQAKRGSLSLSLSLVTLFSYKTETEISVDIYCTEGVVSRGLVPRNALEQSPRLSTNQYNDAAELALQIFLVNIMGILNLSPHIGLPPNF